MEPEKAAPTLFELFKVFNQIALSSFGGATSAWAYRVMVRDRGWMSDAEFLSARAMSQILPGANMINLAVCAGSQFRGWMGALAALAGLMTVPFALIMALGLAYFHSGHVPSVQPVLNGLGAAAAGITFGAAIELSRSRWRDGIFLFFTAVIFVLVGILGYPMIPVALLAGALALLCYRPRRPEGA